MKVRRAMDYDGYARSMPVQAVGDSLHDRIPNGKVRIVERFKAPKRRG